MQRNRIGAVLVVLLSSGLAPSAEPNRAVLAQQLTATIDRTMAEDWQARNIKPAASATDAEFLRRVSLDLIGRIPRYSEVQSFLDDTDPEKRAKRVTALLSIPAMADHFAATTRVEWMPQSTTDNRFLFTGVQFEQWLRAQYQANTPMDQVVSKLLTLENVGRFNRMSSEPTTDRFAQQLAAFYEANEVRPENLAATSSRVFLGVKLECAQCHDHPFAPLTREQFWQTAAFFGEFAALPPIPPSFVGPLLPQSTKNQITIPATANSVVARYFDGTEPDWSADRSPRVEFARWLTSRENPYFARNQVNRMWARFFGIGLIEPIDEPGDANPPSHPGLLEALAQGYAAAGFDNQLLIRAMTNSRAYQLSSRLSHPSQGDPRRFARMAVKGLNGGQIYDSFAVATGLRNAGQLPADDDGADFSNRTLRGQFLRKFPVSFKPNETQTSILQALMMMNGQQMAKMTSLSTGENLNAIGEAPFLTTHERIDMLHLTTLGRQPTDDEREKFSSYVDRGGPTGDRKKALADVYWVLLNSTEFLFNH